MIIKERDSEKEDIEKLTQLLKYDLSSNQRFNIERELNSIRKGSSGEDDSAYYIDFYYGNSKNWAVIHDLRIEHENQVAQIDHILINRFFDFYILESKSYFYGIKITAEGEFEAIYNNRNIGIPSPIEQNKRHIHLLGNFLKNNDILPKRLGIQIRPIFKNLVLVSPKSIIKRPSVKKIDTSAVIKADTLKTRIKKEIDNPESISDVASIVKMSSSSTLEGVAYMLAHHHKPGQIDFKAKFGIKEESKEKPETRQKTENHKIAQKHLKYYCFKCKDFVSEKVAKFCWDNKKRFESKVYCYNCQKNY